MKPNGTIPEKSIKKVHKLREKSRNETGGKRVKGEASFFLDEQIREAISSGLMMEKELSAEGGRGKKKAVVRTDRDKRSNSLNLGDKGEGHGQKQHLNESTFSLLSKMSFKLFQVQD